MTERGLLRDAAAELAMAGERIETLETEFRNLELMLASAGNDPRHTKEERMAFRCAGAVLRATIKKLSIEARP
jgi:hypothetical protein